ncbi:MAG: SDR family oxidoreductase [Gemmatimonadota bacterium]
MELAGRAALVTGGAHRLGRAFVLALAEAGMDVAVHYNASHDAAQSTAADANELGIRAIPIQADLSQAGACDPLIEEATAALGGLDVLVNSASLFESAPVEEISAADWDRVMGLNLRAPFLLSQAAVPYLREGGGAIVNIVDLSAFQAWPAFAHHAVAKAGLVHLTKVLARALAPTIRVNAIAPGTVLPPPDWDGTDNAGGRERRVTARAGRPQDAADALLYLLRGDFTTGQTLVLDGGRMLL